jgi:hypothetical protein
MVLNLEHNHDEPNRNRKFNCLACDAIEKNLQPSEDGLYTYEQESNTFMSAYWNFWDQLKEGGVLFEFETPEGIMVDN